MRPPGKLQLILIIGLFVLYAVARIWTAPPIVEKPRVLADTTAYERISREPRGSVDLWAGSRPALFPLLLKAAQQDYDRAAAMQLALSIPAWGLLAWMVSRFLRPRGLQVAGFGLTLLFSLERHIAGWDFVMMSESLSITTLVLFAAACLWLLEVWRAGKVAVVLLAGLALAFTRDTNAWMLLALAGLIVLATALRWIKPRVLVLAAGLTVVFALGDLSANTGNRWVFPLGNLLTQRVLPDAAAVSYFESCGMPVSPSLLVLEGKFANSDDQAMFTGPELETFRRWLYDHGRGCYIGWLASNPAQHAWEALRSTGILISFEDVDRFFSNRYQPLLPRWLGGILYPERLTLWIWGLSTVAAVLAIWRQAWRANGLWAAFICLNLLVFPHLFLTWHGDAMAPDRHALSVGVQLYLGWWIMVLLLAWHAGKLMGEDRSSTTQKGKAPTASA
jgi:hypothetical protein